eukprot:CAMPEP_0118891476 /NCGR_PEP_ID=MMETSP1166-20130328/1478_1 /TAXON_ID=1104430 /ORGANISM="Chrysoreinhardia sp, Strain CCMP3193" /LENGTH=61 /DNA_ID=CAMNT_0006830141 /DNA_START=524 /DNA_END=709 /DNA_ORIENTATION=-
MTLAARDRDEAGISRRVITLSAHAAAPGNHRSVVAQSDAMTRAARDRDEAGTSRRVVALAI